MGNRVKITDFTMDQVLKMSWVKRWGIIEMSRNQSVAEHSYNVAMISYWICQVLHISSSVGNNCLMWSLVHDLPEAVTGDLPSSFKSACRDDLEEIEACMFPAYLALDAKVSSLTRRIAKVADYLDAILFAQRFCVDLKKDEIIAEMVKKFTDEAMELSAAAKLDLIGEICQEWPRLKTLLRNT